jgi:tetratricopeptide (TPR) repeat protein
MAGFTYGVEQKRARLENLVVPACALMPQCQGYVLAPDRQAARELHERAGEAAFPAGYSVDVPIDCFLPSEIAAIAACGVEIPSIVPEPQALARARDWIGRHADGRKAVAITLREASHGPARNSNLASWGQVARAIEAGGYRAIVIRDTERALDEPPPELRGLLQCPGAALDLGFRAALYQECYLNLLTATGPVELCKHNERVRFVVFHNVEPGSHDTRPTEVIASFGIELGAQLPFFTPFQRMDWNEDTPDNILASFHAMAARIDAANGVVATGSRKRRDEPALNVAKRLDSHRRWRQARGIYRHLLASAPDDDEVNRLLHAPESAFQIGLMEHDRKNYPYAERWFREAIAEDPGNAACHGKLAMTLVAQGRADEAIAACDRAIAINPAEGEAYAVKTLALQAVGRIDEAEAACRLAIAQAPRVPIFHELLADLLKRQGRMIEAVERLQMALELRAEAG